MPLKWTYEKDWKAFVTHSHITYKNGNKARIDLVVKSILMDGKVKHTFSLVQANKIIGGGVGTDIKNSKFNAEAMFNNIRKDKAKE